MRPAIVFLWLISIFTATPVYPQSSDSVETFLFVETAQSAYIEEDKLTLKGIDNAIIVFADRPYRDVLTLPLNKFVENWDGEKNPPNAALTGIRGDKHVAYVLELGEPTSDGDTLRFPISRLFGESGTGEMTNVSLFIDSSSMAWTCAASVFTCGLCAYGGGC